jgi:hypothetical protein
MYKARLDETGKVENQEKVSHVFAVAEINVHVFLPLFQVLV